MQTPALVQETATSPAHRTLWEAWGVPLGIIALAVLAGVVAHVIVVAVARRITARLDAAPSGDVARSVVKHSNRPLGFLLPVAAVQVVLPALQPYVTDAFLAVLRHAISIAFIVGVAWLVIRLTRVFDDYIAARYRTDVPNNLKARKIQTQTKILRQTAVVIIVVIAFAAVLMTFPRAAQLGASVLASAGIAGIVLGLAAQKTLGNLLAGIQIALTEPFAIDDAVFLENEFGFVEEITTTYVVVRIWDKRRLIVPLSRFIDSPFQNWSRGGTDLLGTVFLHTDFNVPVSEIRAEQTRLLEANRHLWDGNVNAVHVVEAKDGRVELRLLMSAAAPGKLFDVRAAVREGMVEFLRTRYPESLSRTRVEVVPSWWAPPAGVGEGRPGDGGVGRRLLPHDAPERRGDSAPGQNPAARGMRDEPDNRPGA